jgi:hypothetical protein
VRPLTLKAAATVLTLAAAAAAAVHVSGHLRSASAPLHPVVLEPAGGDGVTLTPAVRAGDGVQPVTSTYVS